MHPHDPKRIVRKPRGKSRQKNYQPAARLKRLDRSKHMEYKYEMRSLLIKLNVVEEYRSNLLASIWAKGERQSTKEAREYIDEKRDEGICELSFDELRAIHARPQRPQSHDLILIT